jgi:hypothetical protein
MNYDDDIGDEMRAPEREPTASCGETAAAQMQSAGSGSTRGQIGPTEASVTTAAVPEAARRDERRRVRCGDRPPASPRSRRTTATMRNGTS